MTMVRTSETRFAEFEEFENLGGADPLWRISTERMKMRSEHLVPLQHQAVDLFNEIWALNVYRQAGNMRLGGSLFPVPVYTSLVLSENSSEERRGGKEGVSTCNYRGATS